MNIYVNDKPTEVLQDTSIHSLLKFMKIDSFQGIAIGINDQVIPRKEWDLKSLKENDKVLLIRASQGG
ncbi:MAG: sulfur carrier protein ThiS [Bacteroidales bacterium]|nr:sulfur carrier protein ThiS [Bacteroidales bacterium]